MTWITGITAALLLAAPQSAATDAEKAKEKKLHEAFVKLLSGSTLEGRFTIDGKTDKDPPAPERYDITKVQQLRGNTWVVTARIKYGKLDAKFPVGVQVYWANDTPVISMTDALVPGLGTFSCRVLFYGDRYVGTWQHGEVGGHMFGKIETAEDKKKAKAGSEKSDTKEKKADGK